ncbi:MAG: hypothetical protein HY859_02140 [Caulobacterales bacterium]|nr:hypothetical protein [Caulobacterales bacterium]
MQFDHYRCDWDHPVSDDLVVLFYEVSASGDVPRAIHIFADGRTRCLAVSDFADRPHELPGIDSLVEGSFLDALKGYELGIPNSAGLDTLKFSKVPYAEFRQRWCDQRGY